MVWALFIVDDFEAEKKLKAAQAPNSFLSILMGKSGGEATDDRRPAPPSRSEAEMSESAAVFSDATRPELQAPEIPDYPTPSSTDSEEYHSSERRVVFRSRKRRVQLLGPFDDESDGVFTTQESQGAMADHPYLQGCRPVHARRGGKDEIGAKAAEADGDHENYFVFAPAGKEPRANIFERLASMY